MVENRNEQQETLADIEENVPGQLHPILEAAFKNQKQIIMGVVAIVVVAAIYAGITSYNKSTLEKAQAQLGTILIQDSGDEKIAKLETLLGRAPSDARPAILLELAQSSLTNGQYDKAVGYWNQIEGDTDSEMQFVARMGKAKSLTLAGKPAEAVTILKDLVGTASVEFNAPLFRQLAVAAEMAGDKALALEYYKKLAEQRILDKQFIRFKVTELEAK